MNYDVSLVKKYNSHYYKVTKDGEEIGTFPSSTTILKKHKDAFPLMCWAAKMSAEYIAKALSSEDLVALANDEEKMKRIYFDAKKYHDEFKNTRAAEGTAGHRIFELYNLGEDVYAHLDTPLEQNYLLQYEKFIEEHKVVPIAECSEIQVFTTKNGGSAGTLDSLSYVDGKLTLVDYKTSKAIYDEYWIQVASYAMMFEENKKYLNVPDKIKNDSIKQVGILRIGQEDYEFKMIPMKYVKKLHKIFLSYVNAWHVEKEVMKAIKKELKE